MIDFQTSPASYKHWRIEIDAPIAWLVMDVDESGGLMEGYELKLNSYDLGVDIELADAVQRLRFEHPEVKTVVIKSGKDNVFCAGANIRMLSGSTHAHKVNFCKFTNETRLAIEDATENSEQHWITALNGPTAGGGYELAASTDHIILADDSNSAVSLPEVPLLAVLPGTGGLTRLVDKRGVRRDRADVFCTTEEGVKGQRAVDWGLVDELARKSEFDEKVRSRALQIAELSNRPDNSTGVALNPLNREISASAITYSNVSAQIDRDQGIATIVLQAPDTAPPLSTDELHALGDSSWILQTAREFDDLLLHLRLNEAKVGLLLIKTTGDMQKLVAWDNFLLEHRDNWLVNEILLYWKRTLKRLDVNARTAYALIETDSAFAGLFAELLFAVDRSYMFEPDDAADGPFVILDEINFGPLPMGNGLTRLETRFLGEPEAVDAARTNIDRQLGSAEAMELGLVTDSFDDIDWDDEIRIALEERTSFSSDSLTGLEANLRFAGPETLETKIFGRLTAWQNWIFQRPNAAGDDGALKLYGTGTRPDFNRERT